MLGSGSTVGSTAAGTGGVVGSGVVVAAGVGMGGSGVGTLVGGGVTVAAGVGDSTTAWVGSGEGVA
ncbi:MAG TPA: hypothetical protein VM305_01865, partial [Candidatus Limnocylindrales bacterium]|nr:hypothetical protein [Candidatus Limnocylindrales bacterium]